MAESSIFILVIGIAVILIFYAFNITWIDPRIIVTLLFLLVIPGLYGAFTSGPFVPSAKKRHKMMMELAKITKKDIVYDLGCGDGRLVFSAAKLAKSAIGYDISIPLVIYGKFLSLFIPRSSIRFGNIWKQDYSDATVVFCYLLPTAMKKFHKDVWPTLKPGTRVLSNAFAMHELKPLKEEDKIFLYLKD